MAPFQIAWAQMATQLVTYPHLNHLEWYRMILNAHCLRQFNSSTPFEAIATVPTNVASPHKISLESQKTSENYIDWDDQTCIKSSGILSDSVPKVRMAYERLILWAIINVTEIHGFLGWEFSEVANNLYWTNNKGIQRLSKAIVETPNHVYFI